MAVINDNPGDKQESVCILDAFKKPVWESKKRFICLQGGGGSGKAVTEDTKVITPDGYKLMKDIKVGDIVCDTHGGTTRVLKKHHPQRTVMFDILFEDGRKCTVCKDHLWECWVNVAKNNRQHRMLTTSEMYEALKTAWYISIPVADPVFHKKKVLPEDPYTLGHNLSTEEPDEIDISEDYFYSDKEDRYNLLRGILDVRGFTDGAGLTRFNTYSKALCDVTKRLVNSLGGKAYICQELTFRDGNRRKYAIRIRFKYPSVPIFTDKEKQEKLEKYTNPTYNIRLKIKEIKFSEYEGEIYCIEVGAKDKLYLIEDYIVTHNSQAVCQRLCYLFMNYDDVIIAVVRESMPILKRSVYMGDPSIVRTLRGWNVPVDDWWNKTDGIITNPNNKSEFRFIGLDSAEKIKSQNWNYCWLEEATELSLEKWSQCNTRMRRPNKHGPDQMFISYNPISVFNWVIQLFVENPSKYILENSEVHFSNFLDNPFLPKEAIVSMFDTAEKDENYYWTYVVGKPGIPVGQIYPHIKFSYRDGIIEEGEDGNTITIQEPWPKEVWEQKPYYAVDWGWVDPTVITEFREYDGKIWVINRFYEPEKTMSQIIEALKELGCNGDTMVYCDSAEKDRINELALAGLCPTPATKSIHAGIMHVKSQDIVVDATGKYGEIARKEINAYSWAKDKEDPRILLDEPDPSTPNHFCDTLRYGIVTHNLRNTEFSVGTLMGEDVPESQRKKTSAEILADMRKLTVKQ